MRFAWIVLVAACGGVSEEPDARVGNHDPLPGTPDSAIVVPGDATPTPVPPPPGAAAIPFAQWGRYLDNGSGVTVWSRVVAPDGRLYLGLTHHGVFTWRGELQSPADGGSVVEILPDGREGWIRTFLYGRPGPMVALGPSGLYVTLSAWSGVEPSYQTQTLLALDPATGGERWRYAPSVFTGGALRVIEHGDRVYLHGSRLQRLPNGSAVTSAPFLAELTLEGAHVRTWGFDYLGPPDPGPFHFPPRGWVEPGRLFVDEAGLVMVGVGGVAAWNHEGVFVWKHEPPAILGSAAQERGGDIWTLAPQTLARLDRATGEVEMTRALPNTVYATALALKPPDDEPLVGLAYGRADLIFELDGELRGTVGAGGLTTDQNSVYDPAVAWLRRDGRLRGLWSFGEWGSQFGVEPLPTTGGLVVFGNRGDGALLDWDLGLLMLPKSAQGVGYGSFLAAVPWTKFHANVQPRCQSSAETLLSPVGLDFHLVFDISIATTAIVPPTGLPLRQLAANGFIETFQRIAATNDRLSYLLFPWTDSANRAKAPWPTVDRRNALYHGFFTEVALATTQAGSTIGLAIRRIVRGARALTVGHDRGEVRHGILVIVAASANAPSWTEADLATLGSARSGKPALATHIIGLGAPSPAIEALATAAGRPAVYVPIDADVPAAVDAALESIRDDYRCSYRSGDWRTRILAGQSVYAVEPTTRAHVPIPAVESCAPGGAGWMIDRRTWSPSVLMCEATCDALLAKTLIFPEIEPYALCD